MNFNQIMNMVLRQITRRLINGGINKGIKMMSRKGPKGASGAPQNDARATARRARQAARLTRR